MLGIILIIILILIAIFMYLVIVGSNVLKSEEERKFCFLLQLTDRGTIKQLLLNAGSSVFVNTASTDDGEQEGKGV